MAHSISIVHPLDSSYPKAAFLIQSTDILILRERSSMQDKRVLEEHLRQREDKHKDAVRRDGELQQELEEKKAKRK